MEKNEKSSTSILSELVTIRTMLQAIAEELLTKEQVEKIRKNAFEKYSVTDFPSFDDIPK